MVNKDFDRLSTTLYALSDPTRRAILARLALGESAVGELAQPFDMTLPANPKHLKVLERAGLLARGRDAQPPPRAGPAPPPPAVPPGGGAAARGAGMGVGLPPLLGSAA